MPFLGAMPTTSQTKFHQIRILFMFSFYYQNGKKRKRRKTFSELQNGTIKQVTNRGRFQGLQIGAREVTNWDSFRDFQLGKKKKIQIRSGISIRGKTDFESGQGLQIRAEHTTPLCMNYKKNFSLALFASLHNFESLSFP